MKDMGTVVEQLTEIAQLGSPRGAPCSVCTHVSYGRVT